MTNEELILEYRAGNAKALDEIVKQNQGMIYKVALRYKGFCSVTIDFEDFFEEKTLRTDYIFTGDAQKQEPRHDRDGMGEGADGGLLYFFYICLFHR